MITRSPIPRARNLRIMAIIPCLVLGLGGCAPDSKVSSASDTAVAEDPGARIYSGNCVPCHQADGQGVPHVYPSLAGSAVVLGDPGDLALWVIKNRRPASMPPGRFVSVMPPFGWLKPADAAAVLSFVRSHFGNDAPPVDAATVTAALSR